MRKIALAVIAIFCLLFAQSTAQSQVFPVEFQTLSVYYYALVGNFFTPTNGLLGCMGGIVRTTDGTTWDTVFAGQYGVVSMTFAENDTLGYALYTDGPGQMHKILKTTNKGNNWSQRTAQYDFYQLLAWKNQLLGLANGIYLYRSLDSGATWQYVHPFTWAGPPAPMMSADPGNVYYSAGHSVWKSEDLVNWNVIPTPLSSVSSNSTAYGYLTVAGRYFLNGDEHPSIAYSIDNGSSWEHSTNIDLIGDASHALYTPQGVFVTVTDNVQTFQQGQLFVVRNGVWHKLVDTLAVFTGLVHSGNYILCYGYLSGEITSSVLLKIPLTVTSTPVNPPLVPKKYVLEQNYPNPFNPTTNISFTVPRTSYVKLTVYDMTGKTVAQLVDEKKEAGKYSVAFNAATLASGTYFYTLQADGYAVTKKMILTK